jgi:hypothetical protein
VASAVWQVLPANCPEHPNPLWTPVPACEAQSGGRPCHGPENRGLAEALRSPESRATPGMNIACFFAAGNATNLRRMEDAGRDVRLRLVSRFPDGALNLHKSFTGQALAI